MVVDVTVAELHVEARKIMNDAMDIINDLVAKQLTTLKEHGNDISYSDNLCIDYMDVYIDIINTARQAIDALRGLINGIDDGEIVMKCGEGLTEDFEIYNKIQAMELVMLDIIDKYSSGIKNYAQTSARLIAKV